jgi:hypothetical protein
LVLVFIITILIGIGYYFQLFKSLYLISNIKFTDSIEFSFNFLLFFEIIGLVFVIPHSISNSIGKQFQIMSLIFLRTSFEELSNLSFNITGEKKQALVIPRKYMSYGNKVKLKDKSIVVIKPGIISTDWIEVLDGLKEGQTILMELNK